MVDTNVFGLTDIQIHKQRDIQTQTFKQTELQTQTHTHIL